MSGVLSLMVSQETLEDVVNSEVRLMPLAFPQRTNKGSKLQLLCRRHEAGRREVGRGSMGRDILHVSASRLVAEGLLPVCGGGHPRDAAPHPAGPGSGDDPPQRPVQTQASAVPRLRNPEPASLSNHTFILSAHPSIHPSRRPWEWGWEILTHVRTL